MDTVAQAGSTRVTASAPNPLRDLGFVEILGFIEILNLFAVERSVATRGIGCCDTACRIGAIGKRPMFLAGGKNRSDRSAGGSEFQSALRGARTEEGAGVVRDRKSAGNRWELLRERSL